MATGRQMSRRMDRRSIIYIENELLEYTYIYNTCIHKDMHTYIYIYI